MNKISIYLKSNNYKIQSQIVPSSNYNSLKVCEVYKKINNPKSFLNTNDEEFLVKGLRDIAIKFLNTKGYIVKYVLNIYFIKCFSSINNEEVVFELKLLG